MAKIRKQFDGAKAPQVEGAAPVVVPGNGSTAASEEGFLTSWQVAEWLQISVGTLLSWCKLGYVPSVQLRRKRLFLMASVRAALLRRQREVAL